MCAEKHMCVGVATCVLGHTNVCVGVATCALGHSCVRAGAHLLWRESPVPIAPALLNGGGREFWLATVFWGFLNERMLSDHN